MFIGKMSNQSWFVVIKRGLPKVILCSLQFSFLYTLSPLLSVKRRCQVDPLVRDGTNLKVQVQRSPVRWQTDTCQDSSSSDHSHIFLDIHTLTLTSFLVVVKQKKHLMLFTTTDSVKRICGKKLSKLMSDYKYKNKHIRNIIQSSQKEMTGGLVKV